MQKATHAHQHLAAQPHKTIPHHQAKLSFVDELEEGDEQQQQQQAGKGEEGGNTVAGKDGLNGGGLGLRAVTADRFKHEKRTARQHQHQFHHSGGDAIAAETGIAVVDDDDLGGGGDDAAAARGGGGGGGGRASTLGRIHFGASSARGLRPYQEDRHCVISSMQLLSSYAAGGAQAGAPLPHDGVPRSYAAIFDGERWCL